MEVTKVTTNAKELEATINNFKAQGYNLMQRGCILPVGIHKVIPTGEIDVIPFESAKVGKGVLILVKATCEGKPADFTVNSIKEAQAINAGQTVEIKVVYNAEKDVNYASLYTNKDMAKAEAVAEAAPKSSATGNVMSKEDKAKAKADKAAAKAKVK